MYTHTHTRSWPFLHTQPVSVQLKQEWACVLMYYEYCNKKVTHLGQIAAACSPSLPCSRWPCRCPLCSTLVERETKGEERGMLLAQCYFHVFHLYKYPVFIGAGQSPPRTLYIFMQSTDALTLAEKVELVKTSANVPFHLNTLLAITSHKALLKACKEPTGVLWQAKGYPIATHFKMTWGLADVKSVSSHTQLHS